MEYDRCCACGCFLKIYGGWVGESHYDDELYAECNNPRCKSNKPHQANTDVLSNTHCNLLQEAAFAGD